MTVVFAFADEEERLKSKETLIKRFDEYVTKYSVYSDIVLLDTKGRVINRLDRNALALTCNDSFVKDSIHTKQAFVEYFGPSELCPEKRTSLIYSFRVQKDSNPESPVCGVLCLIFKFEDEMEGIFQNLRSEEDRSVLLLMGSDRKVIASSDHQQFLLGSVLPCNKDEEFEVIHFGGRSYLAKANSTKGCLLYTSPSPRD